MTTFADRIRERIDSVLGALERPASPQDLVAMTSALRNLCAALAELEGREGQETWSNLMERLREKEESHDRREGEEAP